MNICNSSTTAGWHYYVNQLAPFSTLSSPPAFTPKYHYLPCGKRKCWVFSIYLSTYLSIHLTLVCLLNPNMCSLSLHMDPLIPLTLKSEHYIQSHRWRFGNNLLLRVPLSLCLFHQPLQTEMEWMLGNRSNHEDFLPPPQKSPFTWHMLRRTTTRETKRGSLIFSITFSSALSLVLVVVVAAAAATAL